MHGKTLRLACLLSTTVIAGSVSAADGRFYINPAIGYQDFDSDRGLDEATTLSIGGEYRYGDNWAAELRYLDSSPDFERGAGDVDVNQYYIDSLYYFAPATEKLQPFALLGLGHAEFDSKFGDAKETQANLGGGVRDALGAAA